MFKVQDSKFGSRWRLSAGFPLLLVLSWPCVAAQVEEAIEKGRAAVREYMSQRHIPGLTLAVSDDGKVLWSEGFGFADLENRVPVWPHTKMRIGSVSKSLTSVGVGILVDRGKLDLDAPVQRYVPSFPEKEHPVTTRLLGGHLSGIRHYSGSEMLSSQRYDTVLAGLKIFERDPLLFKPATKYHYSSYGWNLISAVVEGASQKEFLEFMRGEVFGPLGMRSTVADHNGQLIANRTRFYMRTPRGLLNAPYVDNSYKWAGGGYLSTAEDLLRFANGLLDGKLLRPETLKLLWTAQKTSDGESVEYGIGWFVREDDAGRPIVGHGGGSVGGASRLLVYPEENLAVAWIVNVNGITDAPRRDLAAEIAALFLSQQE